MVLLEGTQNQTEASWMNQNSARLITKCYTLAAPIDKTQYHHSSNNTKGSLEAFEQHLVRQGINKTVEIFCKFNSEVCFK
jgi:hypothetical protein